MEFCPRCKNMLFPKNREGKTILKCHSCGHEVKKFSQKEYKVTEETHHENNGIVILESSKEEDIEEKLKYMGDLYGTDLEFEE